MDKAEQHSSIPPVKTVERPRSPVQLNKVLQDVPQTICETLEKPQQTKAHGESSPDPDMPNQSLNTCTVRQIVVRPVDEPFRKKSVERSTSDHGASSVTNGRVQHNVVPANEAIRASSSTLSSVNLGPSKRGSNAVTRS